MTAISHRVTRYKASSRGAWCRSGHRASRTPRHAPAIRPEAARGAAGPTEAVETPADDGVHLVPPYVGGESRAVYGSGLHCGQARPQLQLLVGSGELQRAGATPSSSSCFLNAASTRRAPLVLVRSTAGPGPHPSTLRPL